MLEYLGWSVVDQMLPFYAISEIWLSFLCVFIQRQVKIQCVQHQWSRRLFWEMQENRGTKRGGVIFWGAVSQSYIGLLHMTHDLWLTECSRLHGYPMDDSLVSSVHTLGYGESYFLQDDNAPCCKITIVKEWKAQHDVHTLRQKSWPKAHR